MDFGKDVKICLPEEQELWAFKCEFCDLILPLYCNYDFKRIERFMDEGPYEISQEVSVEKGDVVFDLGANIGMFSATVARRAKKVYSFEPSNIVAEKYLKKTQSFYDNITIAPYAVSNTCGETVFSYNVNNIGASCIGKNEHDKCIEEHVKLITLDEFVKQNNIEKVDFIKADIEGAERDMLKGATRVLKKFAPKLSLCTYHLPDDKEVLEKLILEANPNYVIMHKYKKLYAYVPK